MSVRTERLVEMAVRYYLGAAILLVVVATLAAPVALIVVVAGP
jgi:hypothetical protein